MGLSFDIETNYGLDVTYWHIARVATDYEGKSLTMMVNGFVTRDARLEGAFPITSKSILLMDGDFISDATRVMLYEKIKSLPEFEGATDD